MSDSLMLHLKLDELNSDNKVIDLSGNGNDGEVNSATIVTDHGAGRCLSFDGLDDSIIVPDSTELQITGNLTIEAWCYIGYKTDITKWVRIVGKGGALETRNYGLWYHAEKNSWLFQQYRSDTENLSYNLSFPLENSNRYAAPQCIQDFS